MADDFKDLINEKRLKRFKDFLDGLFGHLARHALTADTDLNTVTNAGVYYCNDDSTAKTITNKPYERAFWMVVGGISKSISQHYPIQILIPWGFSRFYVRHSANGGAGWSDWVRLATIEEIEKYLGDINDFTTGINLIRGSRDFKAGTELYIQNIYLDGFHSTNEVTYEKDANGFAIAKMQAASSVRSMLGTGVKTELKAGEPITFSFDVMFLEKSGGNVQIGEIRLVNKSGSLLSSETKAISVTAAGLDSANIENNTWYRAVYHCSFGQDINPDEYVLWVFVVSPNASNVAFRKVALNYGNIQHPIWSPSPFDYVLAPINDITMKQNLVIGSKDFKKGTKNNVLTGYSDGFNLVPGSKIDGIDDDGFAILTLENSTTGDKDVYASSNRIPIDNPGDTYTFMFDVRFNEIESLSKYRLFTVVPMNASNASVGQYSWNSSELHLDNAEIGKWYTCCITHTVTTAAVQFFVRPSILKPGSVSYRKVCVYKGRIQNPVWNFNPQDLVTTPVDAEKLGLNDLTTGINLARGSRDFIIGSELFGSTIFPLDGFENRGNYTFSKDDEGFTVASKSQTGLSATADKQIGVLANHKFKAGENVTVSFEFMIDDVEAFDNWRILYVVIQSSTSSSKGGSYYSVDQICETSHTDIKSGVWYKAKYHRLFTEDLADDELLRITLLITQNGSINFRKLMVQEGVINNPIWAPSPFDVATNVNDNTTGWNLVRGSRDFNCGLVRTTQNSSYFSDGFNNGSSFTFTKDASGFTIATRSSKQNEALTISSNVITDVRANEFLTASFDVLFDDIGNATLADELFRINIDQASTSTIGTTWTIKSLFDISDISEIEENKWYSVKALYQIPSNRSTDSGAWFRAILRMPFAGTISFRKLCVQYGFINNPVWNFNPEDIITDDDNPVTGINLLKGTRDFIRGIEFDPVITPYNNDGFRYPSVDNRYDVSKVDDNGFAIFDILSMNLTSGAVGQLASNVINDVEVGETYTAFFDVMMDDPSLYTTNNLGFIRQINSSNAVVKNSFFYDDINGVPVTEFEAGKWYTMYASITISGPDPVNSLVMFISVNYGTTTVVHLKKFGVYKGNIKNPIWAPSPNDALLRPEHGMNLLRGTQNFFTGSGASVVGSFSNGWSALSSNYISLTTEENDFSYITFTSDASSDKYLNSSVISNVQLYDIYTISGEIRIDKEIDSLDKSVLCVVPISGANAAMAKTTWTFRSIGIDNTAAGDWVKFAVTYYVLSSDVKKFFMRTSFSGTGTVSYRKLAIYKGDIKNPEWSPSPFDKNILVNKFGDTNIVNGTNLDDLTRVGLYKCNSSDIAASLSNSPTDKAFWMYVETCNFSIIDPVWNNQIIVDRDGDIFIRYQNSAHVYSEWRKISIANSKGIVPIEGGGTGVATIPEAAVNMYNMYTNLSATISSGNDLYSIWKTRVTGLYSTGSNHGINGLPSDKAFYIMHMLGYTANNGKMTSQTGTTVQLAFTRSISSVKTTPRIYVRHIHNDQVASMPNGDSMPEFKPLALLSDIPDKVTTADIDAMFAGTYQASTDAKVVDDAAIDYAIQKLKEL